MSTFDDLAGEVRDGMEGNNSGIPMGFKRLNNYISIRKSTKYLIGGYTGCLTGDTIVEIGRKQKTANTKRYTLEYVFNQLRGTVLKDKWNLRLPTRIKCFKPDLGQTGLQEIEDVVYSGKKEVYEIRTHTGKTLKATKDHKFMVSEQGDFKRLEELQIGDVVMCKSLPHSRAKGRKLSHRSEVCGKMPYYHTARRKTVNGHWYWRVYTYRVAYDAALNSMDYADFIEEVSTNPNHKLRLSDPKKIIHHIDENPLNNHPDNLREMTKEQHDRLHAKTSNFGYSWVEKDTIVYIEYIGIRDTFDVICKDPYHNFIANEFVVHNSGKTALLDDAFVLNPIDWYIRNYSNTRMRLKLVYFSMERRKNFKLAKWISRKIFLDHGVLIPVVRLLGWCRAEDRLTHDEHDLFMLYRDYIDAILEIVDIQEGPENPTGMRKHMRELFLRNGREERVSQNGYEKTIYVPENPNLIVIKIKDHSGLLKRETGLNSKKEVIDKSSEDDRMERDRYGASIVEVSQFNRDISSPLRLKAGDVEPMLEDFKETGATQEDADIVLSLFDPMRYNVPDPSGYDLTRLRNEQKVKMYRSLKILKNSYGGDDVRIGLAFQPVTGMFKEMPKFDVMTDSIYTSIRDNTYFLNENS